MNLMKITSLIVLLTCLVFLTAFASPLVVPDPDLVAIDAPRSEANGLTAIMPDGPTDPEEFEAFLDLLVADLMEANHIPGGAITVVKDGQVFFTKGYGYADVERGMLATADTTIFRTGSISKVFTWTAVMQLVEQGKLDLNADVNTYLAGFQIPDTFAQPITLAQLMTYTAGFEDQITDGAVYVSADAYQRLQDFLAEKVPARIFPSGQVVAYSNYGAALAGGVILLNIVIIGLVASVLAGDEAVMQFGYPAVSLLPESWHC